MKEYIIPRKSNEEFDEMLEIWHWCERTFGKRDYNKGGHYNWDVGFTDATEDNVTFTFYDESLATLFALRWSK